MKRAKRLVLWGLLVLGGAMAVMMALTFLWVADLRPNEIRDGISPVAESRGRELIERIGRTYGKQAWGSHDTLRVEARDTWLGFMGRAVNPFDVRSQPFRMEIEIGSWTSRITLLEGPKAGDIWGIQDMNVYFAREGKAAEFDPDDDLSSLLPAGFLVPTFQYVYELPFRIATAEIVVHAGEAARAGEAYDRVFATWRSAEGNREVDQYVMWINRSTGRIDRIDHTIREIASSAIGAFEYSDFREVDGAVFPGRITVKAVFPTGGETTLHELTFQTPVFDAVEGGALRPNPTVAPKTK